MSSQRGQARILSAALANHSIPERTTKATLSLSERLHCADKRGEGSAEPLAAPHCGCRWDGGEGKGRREGKREGAAQAGSPQLGFPHLSYALAPGPSCRSAMLCTLQNEDFLGILACREVK